MLFTRMSRGPKISVGRTIAYERPDERTSSSTRALPRKYASGESSEGFVTLSWTMRRTPAALAARRSTRVFATARSNVVSPCANRTQYVL